MPVNDYDNNGHGNDNRMDESEEREETGETLIWKADDCPPEVSAQFRLNVAAYEMAPWVTHFQQLEEAGIELPPPESMDDRELTTKLWEVIDGLARLRVFLSQTDHLSDRELYDLLWRNLLRESVKDLPLDDFSAWHIDLLGSGSEEDTHFYLKYYADEDWRQDWHSSFPDDPIPDRAEPPYERDRQLPQATGELPIEPEDGREM